jgi:hypothetical protein
LTSTMSASLGTISVPANGSLYIQTRLQFTPAVGGTSFAQTSCLNSVKVTF